MSLRTGSRLASDTSTTRMRLKSPPIAESSSAALRRFSAKTTIPRSTTARRTVKNVGASMATRTFSSTGRRGMPRGQMDHYGSLKLHKNATKQQIKARFYELSKQTHPDTPGGSAEKFHEINEAYSVLGDDSKRRDYDHYLSSPSPSPSSSEAYGSPGPHSSPYSDPYNRRSGPHAGWSTRRPPPRAPPTGFGSYAPYGRHTPPGFSGGSSGTYGDPWASAREQFREEFANVRNGNVFGSRPGGGGGMAGGGGGLGGAGLGSAGGRRRAPHMRKSEDMEGSDPGKTWGILALVAFVVFVGGGITTAKAEEGGGEGERETVSGDERDGALKRVM